MCCVCHDCSNKWHVGAPIKVCRGPEVGINWMLVCLCILDSTIEGIVIWDT